MQSILLFYSTYFLFRGNELQKILLLSLNGSRSENSDYCNLREEVVEVVDDMKRRGVQRFYENYLRIKK